MEAQWPLARVAGAPISWGVCEVPGWGHQLEPRRVFAEMSSLGLRATELGPVGYLPLDAEALSAELEAHEMQLVGGFVPLVLHQPELDGARERTEQMAALLAANGADVFVAAAVEDDAWRTPHELSDEEWSRLVEHLEEVDAIVSAHGLTLVVHPHAGTLIERDREVQRLLGASDVAWCLDTGHLLIGGTDPAEFARAHGARVAHVHLKDVDASLAERVRSGELSLLEATRQGLFRPLGQGDARIADVLRALQGAGYERWLVLEQDTAITGPEPPAGGGPVLDVRRSIEYLNRLAPERGEVTQT